MSDFPMCQCPLHFKPDIVALIQDCYRRYSTKSLFPPGRDSLWDMWDFTVACMKAQVKELEEDFYNGNFEHAKKELADHVLVAIDWLGRMGYDPYRVIADRCQENSKKDLGGRGIEYYLKRARGEK